MCLHHPSLPAHSSWHSLQSEVARIYLRIIKPVNGSSAATLLDQINDTSPPHLPAPPSKAVAVSLLHFHTDPCLRYGNSALHATLKLLPETRSAAHRQGRVLEVLYCLGYWPWALSLSEGASLAECGRQLYVLTEHDREARSTRTALRSRCSQGPCCKCYCCSDGWGSVGMCSKAVSGQARVCGNRGVGVFVTSSERAAMQLCVSDREASVHAYKA